MSVLTLRRILDTTDPIFEQGVRDLADAFNTPTWLNTMDNKRENLEANIRATFLDCLAAGGELIFAELPDVGFVGVSAWYAPGLALLATEKQREFLQSQYMDLLLPEARAWWHDYIKAMAEAKEKIYGNGVSLAGYSLQLLGTNPKYHRNGAGRALVDYGLEKAKALGVPAMVETLGDAAIHFYQGCGFEVQGVLPVKALQGETMEFTFMMRPAAASGA